MSRRLAVAVILLAASGSRAADPPTAIPPKDFVEYWSAARVHGRGGDPYDGTQLLPLQREASGDPDLNRAVMLWTPPWTLPLYTPFGLLDPYPAHVAWVVTQLAAVVLSAWLVWRVYAPAGRLLVLAVVPPVVAAAFAPVWWLVVYGQNTGFVLLGVAGFLCLRTRGYPAAAGVAAALTAVKPHVLALFGLALVLDAFAGRDGRRSLLGGVGAVVAASALAVVPDPAAFGQFAAALRRPTSETSVSPADWQVPLVSFHLRMAIDPDRIPIQFFPVAAGAIALIPYWWLRRRTWDWAVEAPRLVFASALVAPYGGWIFDLTILLVPVVRGFARLTANPRLLPVVGATAGHMLLSFATILVPTLYRRQGRQFDLHDFVWFTPAVLGWWVAVARAARPAVTPPGGAGG